MKTKYTTGPWHASGCAVYTKKMVPHWLQPRDNAYRMVAAAACNEDSGTGNWPGENDEKANAPEIEETLANAALIAAAPELCEALREIVDHAERYGAAPKSATLMFDRARAAIAKAEGRQ